MNIPDIVRNSVQLNRATRWTYDSREANKRRRFLKLLKHVMEHSPFYRRHYAAHGIHPRHVDFLSLQDLPPVDKQLLRENFDDAVCDKRLKSADLSAFILDPAQRDRLYLDRYTVIHTSGTTGTPAIFVYGPKEINLLSAVMFSRVNKLLKQVRRTRLMLLTAIEGKYAGVAISDNAPRILYKRHKCSVNLTSEQIAATAQAFQPDVLGGYASAIHLLALEQLSGAIHIRPKSIVCAGEALTAIARQDMIRAFGIRPVNFYASSESMAMAVECRAEGRMHAFDDLHYFETVRDNMLPVETGKTGDLVLTNLYNYTLPLIRYKTSDKIAFDPEPCGCGNTLPVLKKIAGRAEEYLWFEKNSSQREFIHPITFAELFAPGLEKFRIVQKSPRQISVQAKAQNQEEVTRILSQQLDGILALKGLTRHVDYSFDFVEQITANTVSGKFDLIVPYQAQAGLSWPSVPPESLHS